MEITRNQVFRELEKEARAMGGQSVLSLFEGDAGRVETLSAEAAGLFVDCSKNRVSRRAWELLLQLAAVAQLEEKRDAMLRGELVNVTEKRAVLHTALREFSGREVRVGDEDVCMLAARERQRMLDYVAAVHAGDIRGATGKPLTTVVNIGIGGSDLGPQMVVEALRPYWLEGRRTFFVSNVDGQAIADVLEQLDAERTLFVVASKTFTTQETMTNARTALQWFLDQGLEHAAIGKHFVALSTNLDAVAAFGIGEQRCFGFWDWVGGRYSLWSSIGLTIALQAGAGRFLELLQGAHAMDEHFRAAPVARNLPMMLALVGIWNRNIEGIAAHAILPYDQHLYRLPAYLQQADMESNGKSVSLDGESVETSTGPVIFGEPGTNGQHAFYQLLHQGTDPVSADFIGVAVAAGSAGDHHEKLLANLLAQPRALMLGRDRAAAKAALIARGKAETEAERLAGHCSFPGSRPSSVILMERLTPASLGALVALYEHKIFCQGAIWQINSFDQWGVELGKELASELLPTLTGARESGAELDPSTGRLLEWLRSARQPRNN